MSSVALEQSVSQKQSKTKDLESHEKVLKITTHQKKQTKITMNYYFTLTKIATISGGGCGWGFSLLEAHSPSMQKALGIFSRTE